MHISRILGHPSPRFGNLDFDPSLPFYTVIHIHSERHKFEDPFVIEKKTHGKVMAVCCWWKAQVSRFESPPGYTKLAPGQAYSSVQKLPFECWKNGVIICPQKCSLYLFVDIVPKSMTARQRGGALKTTSWPRLCCATTAGLQAAGHFPAFSGMCGNVLEGALNRDIEDTY